MNYIESLFSVKGKTALVTGGATGIGKMIASALASAGARVLICSRNEEACKKAAKEIANETDSKAEGFKGDVSTNEGHKKLVGEIKKRTNKLDILVNNAGVAWGQSYEKFEREAWEKVMNINVTAIFELTRDLTSLLAKSATKQDPSRIINISSVMGIVPVAEGAYSYSASKAAVIHLTKILANELAEKQITVNAIAPGPFKSKMTEFALKDKERAKKMAKQNPMGRIGKAEDIGATTLYLCGKGGGYITGNILQIDGGYAISTMKPIFG